MAATAAASGSGPAPASESGSSASANASGVIEPVLHINTAPASTASDAEEVDEPLSDDDDELSPLHIWDEDSDADEPNEVVPRARPSMLPSRRRRRGGASAPRLPHVTNWWWSLLVGSAQPGTLTVGHVTLNLVSSSLHPGVLLAIPVYFTRAGVVPGMAVLVFITMLSAFGGALWVTLSRYVGGATIESITGRAFGMHTRWKRTLGLSMSSIALIMYCTGAAVVGYHGRQRH